jgi:hypothetical protein
VYVDSRPGIQLFNCLLGSRVARLVGTRLVTKLQDTIGIRRFGHDGLRRRTGGVLTANSLLSAQAWSSQRVAVVRMHLSASRRRSEASEQRNCHVSGIVANGLAMTETCIRQCGATAEHTHSSPVPSTNAELTVEDTGSLQEALQRQHSENISTGWLSN